jgi:spore maturation protein CgeB
MKPTSCPICGNAASFYCGKGPASYFRCGFCGAIYQNPLPSLQEMSVYANNQYNDGLYKNYLEASDLKYQTFAYRLDRVLQMFHRQKTSRLEPRILDVGCSNGRFVELAVKMGMDAWGVELSENAIKAAAPEARARIHHGDANRIQGMRIGKFDIVTAFDLIEHLFDPIDFLRNLHEILTDNGVLVMTTPDAGSLLGPIMKSQWPMLQPFQHTILLSRKAARILLQETEFSTISIGATSKVFTADYLFGQLRGPSPELYAFYAGASKFVPRVLRQGKFRVDIGEIMIAACRANTASAP